MLNILAHYDAYRVRLNESLSGPLGIHRKIEALKHGFGLRMNLGDPDFVLHISNVLSDMLSVSFASALHKTIKDGKTFGPKEYGDK